MSEFMNYNPFELSWESRSVMANSLMVYFGYMRSKAQQKEDWKQRNTRRKGAGKRQVVQEGKKESGRQKGTQKAEVVSEP